MEPCDKPPPTVIRYERNNTATRGEEEATKDKKKNRKVVNTMQVGVYYVAAGVAAPKSKPSIIMTIMNISSSLLVRGRRSYVISLRCLYRLRLPALCHETPRDGNITIAKVCKVLEKSYRHI